MWYNIFSQLLPQLNFAKKAKSERKFIKEGKRRNANAFQVFLTQRNFLYVEHLTARFSWGSNTYHTVLYGQMDGRSESAPTNCSHKSHFKARAAERRPYILNSPFSILNF